MKRTSKTLIATAAITGLLSGAAINQGYSADKDPAPGKEAPAKKAPKVHSCTGQNDCKGLGGCKTGDNGCKFKNSCKGKGGCSITEKDIKNWEQANKKANK